MKFCTRCGTQLEDAARFCSACGASQAVQPTAPAAPAQPVQPAQPEVPVQPVAPVAPVAVQPVAPQPTAPATQPAASVAAQAKEMANQAVDAVKGLKDNATVRKAADKVVPFFKKYRQIFLIGFCLVALLFAILAVTTVTSTKYKVYDQKQTEYSQKYREARSKAASYNYTGILGDGWETVADGWKELADKMAKELWALRARAILFGGLGVGFGVAGFFTYKSKKDEENHVTPLPPATMAQ